MTQPIVGRCFVGDCRDGMRQMINDGLCVQTIVTSPPYWRLRDYGVPGQIGLEDSPQEFVDTMVEVFALARDLLADDGTLWLNLGDTYANDQKWGGSTGGKHVKALHGATGIGRKKLTSGLRPKNLIGVPWRVALALQNDGWILRQDIIWHKPNPMPESVSDRCTKAHEYFFLFSKSEKYYFDQHSIREPAADRETKPFPAGWAVGDGPHDAISHNTPVQRSKRDSFAYSGKYAVGKYDPKHNPQFRPERENLVAHSKWRNKRSVWTVATEGYSDAHFATFPQALIEPCILAGSRPGDIVFDPFMGAGTTAKVAQALGRHWMGCELNPDYLALQADRVRQGGLILEIKA
jgi:site-specific DNA-methyltransferase (cytosine-N4-specific)